MWRDITKNLETNESGVLLYDAQHIVAEAMGQLGYRFRMIAGELHVEARVAIGTLAESHG